MKNLNLKQISENIFSLFEFAGIQKTQIANILGVSNRQITRINRKKTSFSVSSINIACAFFDISIDELNQEKLNIMHDIRDKLLIRHKNNLEYYHILTTRPSITYAIKHILLHNTTFIEQGFTAGDIRKLFLEKGLDYDSKYISTAMARNSTLVDVIGSKTVRGKTVNIYGPLKDKSQE